MQQSPTRPLRSTPGPWPHPQVGSIQPIKEIAAIARAHGALCHSDAAQSIGKVRRPQRPPGAQLRAALPVQAPAARLSPVPCSSAAAVHAARRWRPRPTRSCILLLSRSRWMCRIWAWTC
jgi:hypothetical protein